MSIETLTLLGVFVAATAAGFSYLSARAAKKASEAQVLLRLMEEYGQNQMVDDLRDLAHWKNTRGNRFIEEYRTGMTANDSEALRVDGARRRVREYFRKAVELEGGKHISPSLARQAVNVEGVRIFTEVVKPIEYALNPKGHNRALFATVEQWAAGRLARPWEGLDALPKTGSSGE